MRVGSERKVKVRRKTGSQFPLVTCAISSSPSVICVVKVLKQNGYKYYKGKAVPVKNVTGIFSRLFDGSLVWFENETKSAREIPSFS